MKTSESIKEISAAFCLAQAEMGGVINNKQNPAFKNNGKLSTYADLMAVVEAVKQPFCNHDLAFMQFPISNSEGMGVITRIMHKSGEWIESEFTMPLVKVSAHGAGSNFTYARRYALSAACGLPTQDDDGNTASLAVEPSVYIDDMQLKTLTDLLEETNTDVKAFCKHFEVASANKLLASQFDRAIAALNEKEIKSRMIISPHEQGTEEWLAARLGKPSASMFSKLITMTGKPSSSAGGYINQLLGERLTGKSEPHYQNEHMIRGNELEPEARADYEFISGNTVDQFGFILDDSESYGCSPDGLIGDSSEGGLEIKCPAQTTQAGYWRDPQSGVKKYYQQIQGCMWVTGREWWDFFSYHPDMPHVLVRVKRDKDYIEKLSEQVLLAVSTIEKEMEKRQ